MLTLFTIPKPFTGEVAELQRDALRSWRKLGSDLEILVFGDEEGIGDAAAEVAATHVPDIARTELGTPIVADAFERAAALARTPLLCYANADIALAPDLLDAAARLRRLPAFLALGRRLDVPNGGGAPRLHGEWGLDWFLFPRDMRWEMPPFAVGRPGWDNWLVWRARDLGLAVVDATDVITAAHVEHGYGHVPEASGDAWEGPEADRNRELMGGKERRYSILDATHVMDADGIRRALSPPHLRRRTSRALESVPALSRLARAVRFGPRRRQ